MNPAGLQPGVLIVLDGAPEPVQPWPTTLEAASTPSLDALCAAGAVGLITTTPPGHAPGPETGLPALLGALPETAVGRGPVAAAGAGIELGARDGAWLLEVRHEDGRAATEREVHLLWSLLRTTLPNHCIVPVGGEHVVALGARRPRIARCAGLEIVVCADGADLPPALLGCAVTFVCAHGPVAGVGRLLGARVIVPPVDDFAPQVGAAIEALERGHDVVVHAGGADDAARRRDRHGKREFLERADRQLVGPLAALGVRVTVTAAYGTCPWTGRRDRAPVPVVTAGPGVVPGGPDRLAEARIEVLA